ncbi:MAG TPA: hypothetical protein VNA25_28510 [Phycisphaerae bacterium]|nr:hypothetical protein [Phycisphaerae bacterium]
MLKLGSCLLSVVLLAVSASSPAAVVTDNFNDNSRSSQWTLVEDDPTKLWLAEANERLELCAASPTSSTTDALYLSNGTGGFQVKTDSNFTISIDYSFTSYSGTGLIGLDLGIGKDIDGNDSAAVAYFRSNTLGDQALGAAYRVSDVQSTVFIGYVGTTGTLSIAYNSAIDRLTLGDGNNSTNLDNLVKGQWSADQVWVSFGGRGNGLTLANGNAYLDNLVVTGDIVPEPATLSLLALSLPLLKRRRTRL